MSRFQLALTALALLAKKPVLSLFAVVFVFLFGMMSSGLDEFGPFSEDQQLIYSIFSVYLLLAFFGGHLYGGNRIDAWPMSRQALFNLVVIPLFLAQCGGLITGELIERHRIVEDIPINFSPDQEGNWRLTSPLDFDQWTLGEHPLNQIPGKKAFQAWSSPVVKGTSLVLFGPFNTPSDPDRDTVAFQLHKAMLAIYGQSPSRDEISRNYLRENQTGKVVLNRKGQVWVKDMAHLKPHDPIHALPPLLGVTFTLWMLALALLFKRLNGQKSSRQQKTAFWVLLGFFLSLHVVLLFLAISKVMPFDMPRALYIMLIRQAGESTLGVVLLWVVPVVFSMFSYQRAVKWFGKVEFTGKIGCI